MTEWERRVTPTAVRRRRRRLFWWSLPVVLVAIAAAAKFGSLSAIGNDAVTASEEGRLEDSIEASDALMTFNWFEPWIAYYNRGTASAQAQEYNDATDDLSVALDMAPPERSCEVRVNLALAWEELGDIYLEAGYLTGATLIYDTALAVIEGGREDGCFDGEDEESEEENPAEAEAGRDLEDAKERIEGKQDAAQGAAPEGDGGSGGGEDAGGGGSDAEQDLEDRGTEAERDRRNQDADRRGGGEYTDKPW